jgi:hypothetical protein
MDAYSHAPSTQHDPAEPARPPAGPVPTKGFASNGNGNPVHVNGSSPNGASPHAASGTARAGERPTDAAEARESRELGQHLV